jgi:hypothetical protein
MIGNLAASNWQSSNGDLATSWQLLAWFGDVVIAR